MDATFFHRMGGRELNSSFRCSLDFFFFFLTKWVDVFVRWKSSKLLHTMKVFEEVTWSWGRSNNNIGLHSSGDSSCVDTRQNGDAAKAPLCLCACVSGENASSGGHGVRDLQQTEAQPLGKENKIGIAWPRVQIGDVIAGEEKPVKCTLRACTPGMAGL